MNFGTLFSTTYRYEVDLHGPQYYARRLCLQEQLDVRMCSNRLRATVRRITTTLPSCANLCTDLNYALLLIIVTTSLYNTT